MGDEQQPANEPEQLESPLKPLLWILIPFVLMLIYGIFGNR